VRSYLAHDPNAPHLDEMRSGPADVDTILTGYRGRGAAAANPRSSASTGPYYNVLLKDDKSFPFVKLSCRRSGRASR
jgi:excinuclease UvrABC nuclease subunit